MNHGTQHVGKTAAEINKQIRGLAAFHRGDAAVAAFDRRMAETQCAGKFFDLDPGKRFAMELRELIQRTGGNDLEIKRRAAVRFIAQSVANLYGVTPEEATVRKSIEESGPVAVRQAAAEMIRRGRENIHSPFGILRKRAWSIFQRKARAS